MVADWRCLAWIGGGDARHLCAAPDQIRRFPHRPRRHAVIGMLIFVFVGAAIRCASADENPAALGGKYGLEADVEGQANPWGLGFSAGAWYRDIYHKDESPLWNGLYVQGGGLVSLNPAYGQLGAYLEWMPITVLQLHAQIDRYEYFGRDGSLLIFNDRNARFGSRQISERHGQEQTGHADRLLLQPTLQGEFGRYVVVDQASYVYYAFSRDGPYFWDQEYDTLLKKRDRLHANDLSLLYNFSPRYREEKLLVGPSFQVVHATGADLTRERLGISLDYEPVASKSVFGYLRYPRYYLQIGVNVEDRNRAGQLYLLGGFGADFDLN